MSDATPLATIANQDTTTTVDEAANNVEKTTTVTATETSVVQTTERTSSQDATTASGDTPINSEKGAQATATPIARSSPRTPFDFVFRHAADSTTETRYLQRSSLLELIRLIQSVFTISFGAAIIALEALVLQVYNHTRLSADYYLPLWPTDINVVPTTLPLVAACIAVFLSLIYVIVSIVPSPHSRTSMLTWLYMITSALSSGPLFATVVFEPTAIHGIFSLLPTVSDRPTIQSWTCTLSTNAKNFVSDGSHLGLIAADGGALSAPVGFSDVCEQTRYAFGMVIALFVVVSIGVSVGAVGVNTESKIINERMKRYESTEEVDA